MAGPPSTLHLLVHPYVHLFRLAGGIRELRKRATDGGVALVWTLGHMGRDRAAEIVNSRPGGVSLLVVLPPHASIEADPKMIHLLQNSRAHGILPFHPDPSPSDLTQVLRRPPTDLSAEVVEYVRWRGLSIDRETAQLIRRIIDLSRDLRSISAVSRSMYLSRRALGRRFMSRGLPVPSHWLQMGRLLRVTLRLQNSNETVSSIGFELGYPDGFAVSNQMERLFGHRPTHVRDRLGWEWVMEAWLKQEAEGGGLRLRSAEARPMSDSVMHPEYPKNVPSPRLKSPGGRKQVPRT